MAPNDPIAHRLTAAVAVAHALHESAATLRAQGRRARARARSVPAGSNAILDSATAIASKELADRRIALAEPVAARFQTDEAGNTGVELTVKLRDPARTIAARDAITRRFGGQSACDTLHVS